jgi:UDP-N-acetylmuramate dehydrogenase
MKNNIQQDVSLQPYNTLNVAAMARYFSRVESKAELQTLLTSPQWQDKITLILGGGSNILLTQDIEGLVIKINIMGIEKIKEDNQHVWLQVGAGENWHQLVLYCIEHGFAGIENLSLIPGTVGAAPMQNIGAYGVELQSVFDHLNAINRHSGEIETFYNKQCEFGYRSSVFKHALKNKYIITDVTLKLNKTPQFHTSYGAVQQTLNDMGIKELSLKAVSDAVIKIRQQKLPDPAALPNAGSFFKNPIISHQAFSTLQQQYLDMPHYPASNNQIKIPAAWLIEQCGFKGKRLNGVGVHEHQALVLINYNQSPGIKIKNLADEIQQSVNKKFAIELVPEVNII